MSYAEKIERQGLWLFSFVVGGVTGDTGSCGNIRQNVFIYLIGYVSTQYNK